MGVLLTGIIFCGGMGELFHEPESKRDTKVRREENGRKRDDFDGHFEEVTKVFSKIGELRRLELYEINFLENSPTRLVNALKSFLPFLLPPSQPPMRCKRLVPAISRSPAAASEARLSSRDPMTTGCPAMANRSASPRPSGPVPPITAMVGIGLTIPI